MFSKFKPFSVSIFVTVSNAISSVLLDSDRWANIIFFVFGPISLDKYPPHNSFDKCPLSDRILLCKYSGYGPLISFSVSWLLSIM